MVNPDTNTKLSIVDIIIAIIETINRPWRIGGRAYEAKSKNGLYLTSDIIAAAYSPVTTDIKSNINQNRIDIIIAFLAFFFELLAKLLW